MRIAHLAFLIALGSCAAAQENLPYTVYTNFDQVLEARNARYPTITRVSDPSPEADRRAYTGFFFYQVLQFDRSDRYLLGLRVYKKDKV